SPGGRCASSPEGRQGWRAVASGWCPGKTRCAAPASSTSIAPMGRLKDLQWFLVLGLGAFALVRPLLNVVGVTERLGKPQTQLAVTALVTLVWVAVVGFTRVAEPLLTLVFAGLAYGVFAIVLSGVLSPVLLGELQ